MRILLVGILVFITWSAFSTHFYVCKIKGLCKETVIILPNAVGIKEETVSDTLIKPSLRKEEEIPGTMIVNFAFDKSDFQPDASTDSYFDKSKAYMDINRQARLNLTGHTDAIVYFSGRIERDEWVSQAKELVLAEEHRIALFKRISDRKDSIYYNRIGLAKKEDADDLTVISGIGGWIMKKLNMLDIYTLQQISHFNNEDVHTVTEAIEYFPGRIERDEWITQAKELIKIAGKKAELLKRIRERKGRIYYDGLGIAQKHEANNLTLIDGLGLWVEERLNTLDIYTFEQISKLTHREIETITEVLELIPGRIEQDNWVDQAHHLAKKHLKEVAI